MLAREAAGELRHSDWMRALTESDRLGRVLLIVFVIGLATSITLAQSTLAVLAIRWLWRLAGRTDRARGWPLAAPFLAWIGTSLLAALLSARPLGSLLEAKDLALIAIFYVIVDGCQKEGDGDWLLSGLLVAMTAAAILGILQVALCGPENLAEPMPMRLGQKCTQARGFYSIKMTFGGAQSLVILATLPLLLSPTTWTRVWRAPLWVTCAAAFALSYVRGAWLGFLAGVLAQAALLRRTRAVLVATALVLVAIFLLVPSLRERAATIPDPTYGSSQDRLQMWQAGLAIFHDHPMIGVGPGQVKHVFPGYALTGATRHRIGHVHSTPLQVLDERGLLGFIAWGWIFAAFFARSVRILRELPPEEHGERALVAGSIGAIAGFLVGGLTEYNFGDSEVVMIAYLIMALPFVVARGIVPRGNVTASGTPR